MEGKAIFAAVERLVRPALVGTRDAEPVRIHIDVAVRGDAECRVWKRKRKRGATLGVA